MSEDGTESGNHDINWESAIPSHHLCSNCEVKIHGNGKELRNFLMLAQGLAKKSEAPVCEDNIALLEESCAVRHAENEEIYILRESSGKRFWNQIVEGQSPLGICRFKNSSKAKRTVSALDHKHTPFGKTEIIPVAAAFSPKTGFRIAKLTTAT